MNISDDKFQNLISMASKQMGLSEDQIKNNIKNKSFDDPKLNELLNNPEKAKELIKHPDIKKLMRQLFEKE